MKIKNIEYDYKIKMRTIGGGYYNTDPVATIQFELDSGLDYKIVFNFEEVDGKSLKDIKHLVLKQLSSEVTNDSDWDNARHLNELIDKQKQHNKDTNDTLNRINADQEKLADEFLDWKLGKGVE
mgnify:FL=1